MFVAQLVPNLGKSYPFPPKIGGDGLDPAPSVHIEDTRY